MKQKQPLSGRPKFEWHLLYPRHWPTWIALGVMWAIVQLPYSVLVQLAKIIAWLFFHFSKSRRHIAQVNLRLCFPEMSEQERNQLLKDNFFSAGMGLFEMGITWWWPKWRYKKLYRIEGLEHLEKLQAQGKGVLLISCHFTHLDFGGGAVAHHLPVDALFRAHKNPVFDYVQACGRCSNNPATQLFARENVKDMVKALRSGRTVWHAPDQDFGTKNREQSVFVNLFGVPAATITTTSRIVKSGKAVVVPFTQKRLKDGSGYLVQIHPPVEGFPAPSDREDAELLIALVEKAIRDAPDQYMWVHRRFKTRPLGEPPVY